MNKLFTSLILKRVLVSLIVLCLVIFLLTHKVFRKEFLEFNLLVKKYCYMNISQNSGLHKFALQTIWKLTVFLPENDFVEIKRSKDQVGINEYSNEAFYSINQIDHTIVVANENQLQLALKEAKAGTEILIRPGIYKFSGGRIGKTQHAGEPLSPIVIRAEKHGDVTLLVKTREGLVISQPFWRIENLIFRGEKNKRDTWIDHAVHIVGDADFITIENNSFINFNAHVKANGAKKYDSNSRVYPDHGIIKHNNFYNEWKRNTSKNSVISIDIVGGDNWLVKNNFIADFGKNGNKGKGITNGAFFKGGSTNGIFTQNLVACEWKLPHTNPNDIRIGLSLGGGGTGKSVCMSEDCAYEHKNGLIDSNLIVNCKNDVGIYLNKATNSTIQNNILLNTLGIDVRYTESSAQIINNRLNGRVRSRDGGVITVSEDNQFEDGL